MGEQHIKHLYDKTKNYYALVEDWKGALYFVIKFDWDYRKRTVELSITGYNEESLHKYHHIQPKISQQA